MQHGVAVPSQIDRWAMHAALVRVIAAALAPSAGSRQAPRAEPPSRFRLLGRGCRGGDAGAAGRWTRMHSDACTTHARRGCRRRGRRGCHARYASRADVRACGGCQGENSPSPLESDLGPRAARGGPRGGSPLAAAVASYAAYPFDAVFRPLALPALAAPRAAAPADPPLAAPSRRSLRRADVPSAFDSPYKHAATRMWRRCEDGRARGDRERA